jgi:hypothetical protein
MCNPDLFEFADFKPGDLKSSTYLHNDSNSIGILLCKANKYVFLYTEGLGKLQPTDCNHDWNVDGYAVQRPGSGPPVSSDG